MSGNDWGDVFAAAVNGNHFQSPLGIADIELGDTAWSAKTVKSAVKSNNPITAKRVRLISGRCSPVYSFGNVDPLSDVQLTGSQVLRIWNARVEEAHHQFAQLRTVVLMRDMVNLRFTLFEQPTVQFDPADYVWGTNRRNNLEGRSVESGFHAFTWQPHGSQFTIIRSVSGSARNFRIERPPALDSEQVLNAVGYSDNWVTFIG